MKNLIMIFAIASGLQLQARTIHCSDNENILNYLRIEVDEKTMVGKVELKSTAVNTMPSKLLGIGDSSIGYVGLLTVDTPNVKCFFTKDAPEPVVCDSGPNGAGNGNFSSIQVEGDTDFQIPEIDNIRVVLVKNITISAGIGNNKTTYPARVSIAKYSVPGPNKRFDLSLTFEKCMVSP